jgi:hypothetical protein
MLRWKSSLKPTSGGGGGGDNNPGTTNLVGGWSMDETSGTRADSDGSNDLTDNNTVGYATGVISNAASFVAANTEYLSSTTVPVSGTGARSVEVWFKTSTSGTMHIVGFGTDNGGVNGGSFRLSIESGALWCKVYGGAASFGGTWNNGSWHHVVFQVQASGVVSDIELYVDGSSQTRVSGSTLTRAIDTGTGFFYVGRNIQSTSDNYFDGDVDILRIFNDELTADEITWLYNSGSGKSYSDVSGGGSTFPSTSLVGFYKLGEASGVDAADSSGNGYDFSDNGTVASTTGTIGGETVNVRTLDRPAGKYFSLSDTGAFDVGDGEDFTISFWAKVSSSMGNYDTGGIFSKRHNVTASDAGYQICLKKANSTTYVRYNAVCDGTTTLGDSNTDAGIATDAWAHYMMVFTADATLITYVNNAQYSSVDVSSVTGALTNTKDNYIGQLAYNNNGSIIADVTHLGFWKKALDSSERTALYNSGKVLAPAVAADITLEASAENEDFTGYSSPYDISVSYPAVSANYILLAIISTERRIDFNGTPPTGWTKVIEADGDNSFNPTQAVYWKRATGSAAATSETWGSLISGAQQYHAWVGAYSGCVTSVSPIDASAGFYQGYATSWSISITTQTNNAMILAVAGSDSNTRTFVWSDGTELIDKVYQSTATVTINEKIKSTAGATTRAGTMSSGQSGTITAVSLRPVGGEPTPLQSRNVTFTSISEFTIDSDSGQEIWKSKLNQANVGSGLRLWNGSEAGNSGATQSSGGNWPFSSGGNCATWWENYYIRVKQDPGTGTYSDWINWTNADGDIYTSCQPEYNNIGSAVVHYSGPGTWTTHASGFKYQVEIYSASNRP